MGFHRKGRFTFEPMYAKSIRELCESQTEMGGGILLDKKKSKIVELDIFPSDRRSSITFGTKRYDIEFHTHPIGSGSENDLLLVRMPSFADVASTFTTGKEEIVFTKGYIFTISIYDKNLFEATKRYIRKTLGSGRFDTIYDRNRAYFQKVFENVRKKSHDLKHISMLWKRTLKKSGVEIKKVNIRDAEFNVY